MATVQQRIDNWRKSELRWEYQVNNEVALLRYNKWLQIFQKELLEYVANQGQVTSVVQHTVAGQERYQLPFNFWELGLTTDFYSIAQLRVANEYRADWYPKYRVCEPISLSDYNVFPNGRWIENPSIWKKVSFRFPKYSFESVYNENTERTETYLRIYPTPTKSITAWIMLQFNYINRPVIAWTDEDLLALPRYFLDVIDDYMSYRLYQAENPELAASYYQTFIQTLHNNIYGLNRDQRPVEEDFADLRHLYHN